MATKYKSYYKPDPSMYSGSKHYGAFVKINDQLLLIESNKELTLYQYSYNGTCIIKNGKKVSPTCWSNGNKLLMIYDERYHRRKLTIFNPILAFRDGNQRIDVTLPDLARWGTIKIREWSYYDGMNTMVIKLK